MPKRTYNCSLNVTITVDDETLKSAMLGFGLSEGLNGPPVDDPDAVFAFQEQMLGAVRQMPAKDLMQVFLVNGYFVPISLPIRTHLMDRLPGSEVSVTGIDVALEPEG